MKIINLSLTFLATLFMMNVNGQQNQVEEVALDSYLFVYFTGNSQSQEAIHYALSDDGFNYKALNDNKPVIKSEDISSTGGVRDPHIIRQFDKETYYMVATDMVSANGWESNHGIVLLRSNDLIHWTASMVDIKTRFPEFKDIDRAWAPQTIYDFSQGKYMVYFSLHQPDGLDIIYYSYANENFTDLATKPVQLFYSQNNTSCIDADIVHKDGQYHLFHKNETGGGIFKAVSDSLTSGYVFFDKAMDQTTSRVEGSGVFKLINSENYVLMYDLYTSGA